MKKINAAKLRSAIVRYVLLAIGTVVFTLPMLYMISTSLRPNGALYEYPPRFFPRPEALTLENYDYILHQSKFYLNFLNSVFVSVSTILIAAAVASAMAFVIGKFKTRATKTLFAFIIITMIIPGTTMIVPQFELATKLGLVNKLWGLIPFYVAWVIPFSTFMIKGFMENIPNEIMEACWIDGADVWTVYTRVALPLASPALASVSIFNFLTAWEEYGMADYMLPGIVAYVGWIPCALLTLALAVLLTWCVRRFSRLENRMGALFGMTAALTMCLQAVIYVPASFGLIGEHLSLPLLSYGHAILMVDAALAGMMLGVLRGETLPEPTGTLRKSYSVFCFLPISRRISRR